MKKVRKNLLVFVMAIGFAVSFASVTASACDYLLGGVDQGVTCYRTGQDAQWCYYTCYCTGTQQQCNQFYELMGLQDV